ncbi:DUF2771 domain-containing protein [Streptomyces gardneri]|uniref:DUF2771 domain-containing protein n=1 Tax=Nocardia TaxID=1817 RepID=UPI0013596FD5|nr:MULTISPECIES: DUF2771 domain-containing protein [Nocardia]MBF6165424.1 DUF2771 domain-containing protein [Streptomyces gardneri]MBF6205980.1 DUF2771 domain-containing protein [Streptomyces gardneri]
MSKLNTRTIAALVAAALLVLTVAFAGVLAVLIRDADEPDVTLTAYAHGKTITVRPFSYCAVTMRDCSILPAENVAGTVFATLSCAPDTPDCHRGRTVELEVPAGYPLQLSLPKQVADAPWLAQLVYLLPNGEKVDRVISRNDYPDRALALTIDSKPEPDLRLIGVEFQLPILARDETGREFYVPHATWSISTA